jgi:hypothetical protein
MTDPCHVCEHYKIQAINAAIAQGRLPSVVARQFRLERQALDAHIAHEPALAQAPKVLGFAPDGPIMSRTCEDKDLVGTTTDEGLQTQVLPDTTMVCDCYWCMMTGYQRLLRAWTEANTDEKHRFCADTRDYEVPF